MINLVRLTEEGLIKWLRSRLEKREYMNGYYFSESELWEQIYDIIFYELKTGLEEIERYFIPFGQAGYLPAKRKLELMLFILEKDYGNCFYFLQEVSGQTVITENVIEQIYRNWALEGRLLLSDEEKREFFVRILADQMGLGVLAVLQRIAADGIFLGELCPSAGQVQCRGQAAVRNQGELLWLPVLSIEDQAELIRIIKMIIAGENRGELTAMEPFWECVREDGSCITAIRPPAGKDWGIRILYGASGKEQKEW
ncbi:MAG: hypothetical protein J6A77_13255 [Lachnospiraceae bacterium]|nr:hypothetical protein [Lachnospiraceae bacterium]